MCDDDKKYLMGMAIWAVAYLSVTFASVWSLKNYDLGMFSIPVAISPMIVMLGLVKVIMARVRAMDELQRQIHLEACVFSLLTTGLLCGSMSFLENAGIPPVSLEWVMPMLIVTWGIGSIIARKRYM